MMQRVTAERLPEVKAYLERDLPNCLYLYMDLVQYGLTDPNVRFYCADGADGLCLIAMEYYRTMQLFALTDDWDVDAIAEMVRANGYTVVNARMAMIERLLPLCPAYTAHGGTVYEYDRCKRKSGDIEIEVPDERDYDEIAALICSDANFAHYTPDGLAAQMRERAERGMGRSIVIRNDAGRIIAHIGTFAECGDIAITSGLIVDPAYRSFPYGSIIEIELVNRLLDDGMRAFSFVTAKNRRIWLKSLHCKLVADYGKMVPRETK